ncbi:MAG TPA: hypothetical protein VII58_14045 [Acidobacteriaceae bacterium]
MEYTQLQRRISSGPRQSRPFVYRSANPLDAPPHPLRRATDSADGSAAPAPRALFAEPAQAVLLQFRVAVRLN